MDHNEFLDELLRAQVANERAKAEAAQAIADARQDADKMRELLKGYQQFGESAVAALAETKQLLQDTLEALLHFRQRAHTFTDDPDWIACGWVYAGYVKQADDCLAAAKNAGFKVTVKI